MEKRGSFEIGKGLECFWTEHLLNLPSTINLKNWITLDRVIRMEVVRGWDGDAYGSLPTVFTTLIVSSVAQVTLGTEALITTAGSTAFVLCAFSAYAFFTRSLAVQAYSEFVEGDETREVNSGRYPVCRYSRKRARRLKEFVERVNEELQARRVSHQEQQRARA